MRIALAVALPGLLLGCGSGYATDADDNCEVAEVCDVPQGDAGTTAADAGDAPVHDAGTPHGGGPDGGTAGDGPEDALSTAQWVRSFSGPSRDEVASLAVLDDGTILAGASRSSLETGCEQRGDGVEGSETVGVAHLRQDGTCTRWYSAAGTASVVALARSNDEWVGVTEGWVDLTGTSYANRTSAISKGTAGGARAFAWQPTSLVVDLKSGPDGEVLVLEWSPNRGELTATLVEATADVRWRRSFARQSFLSAFTAGGDVILAGDTYGAFEIDGLHVEGGPGTPVLMRLAGDDGRALWVRSLPDAQGTFTSAAVHGDTVVGGGLLYSYQPSAVQWGTDRLESSGGPFVLTTTMSGDPGWVSPVGAAGTYPLVAVGELGIVAALTSDDQCRDQRVVAVDWSGQVRTSTPFLSRPCLARDADALFRVSSIATVGADAVVAGSFTGTVPGGREGGDLTADGADGFVARLPLAWGN